MSDCATPQMAAHQAPLSLGFSRQEHWSGLPFPSPVLESEVAQLCPTLSNPMDCRLPGSSARGIFQARELEWVALPSPYLSLERINQFHSVKHLLDIHWYSCTVTCLPFHISADTWCVCVVGWGSPGPSEQCLA